ncbi:glutamine amidotransferase [Dyella sp.]|uniref:glutamine amidotransferase n=1 Tax=Dyella sp. TaxID=1869338 RepID=UPI002ED4E532
MKPVLIIRTGRAPHPIRARFGDFPHWFRIGAQLAPTQIRVVDVEAGEDLPAPGQVAGALITGSASMVTERLPWSERAAGWIRDAMDVDLPMFGVCYGHQLMSHALGGRVDYLPGGREIGTVSLEAIGHGHDDAVAGMLPPQFRAHATHEQSVLEAPKGAVSLLRSDRDGNHLLRYGAHAMSVQFHPEFNADVMRAYIHRKRHDMHREGFDPQQTYRQVAPTPFARRLLRQFARRHGWAAPSTP